MNKIFLDTNILIDFLDKKRNRHKESVLLLEKAINNDVKLGISEDILTTVFYVCKKNIKSEKIFSFFSTLQETINIHSFGSSCIKQSIKYAKENNTDFEDTLQAFCAYQNQYDIIITNDKNFPQIKLNTITSQNYIKK